MENQRTGQYVGGPTHHPNSPHGNSPYIWKVISKCKVIIYLPSKLKNELVKEVDNATPEARNALMVVATLIATITFGTALEPPTLRFLDEKKSGLYIDANGNVINSRILVDKRVLLYKLIYVFNTSAFVLSLATISLLADKFPLKALVRLSMVLLAATYVCLVSHIPPIISSLALLDAILVGGFVICEIGRFVVWLTQKLKNNDGHTSTQG